MDGDEVTTLVAESRTARGTLIEDFMIAANGTIARYSSRTGSRPPPRRALPRALATIRGARADLGERLPGDPDAPALNAFL